MAIGCFPRVDNLKKYWPPRLRRRSSTKTPDSSQALEEDLNLKVAEAYFSCMSIHGETEPDFLMESWIVQKAHFTSPTREGAQMLVEAYGDDQTVCQRMEIRLPDSTVAERLKALTQAAEVRPAFQLNLAGMVADLPVTGVSNLFFLTPCKNSPEVVLTYRCSEFNSVSPLKLEATLFFIREEALKMLIPRTPGEFRMLIEIYDLSGVSMGVSGRKTLQTLLSFVESAATHYFGMTSHTYLINANRLATWVFPILVKCLPEAAQTDISLYGGNQMGDLFRNLPEEVRQEVRQILLKRKEPKKKT